MPGKGAMPKPGCNPNVVSWSGVETGQVENNSPVTALTDAVTELTRLQKAADTLMNTFEAQGCPTGKDGCSFLSAVRGEPTVTITGPTRKPGKKHGFKMTWVVDVKVEWTDSIYCYKKDTDKKAADEERAKAKAAADKEKEQAAKAADHP